MAWSLVARGADESHGSSYSLRPGRTSCIALAETNDNVLVVDQYAPELQGLRTLARIDVAGWGVKLEALASIAVVPYNPRSSERIQPNQEQYKLDSSGRTEVIFLRDNDKVYFPEAGPTINVTLKYADSEVQVNSSVTADAEVAESVDQHSTSPNGVPAAPAESDETEDDDEDLDNTITATATLSNERRTEATPMPSMPRSEIVQETPATNRTYMKKDQTDESNPPADDAPEYGPMNGSYAADEQEDSMDIEPSGPQASSANGDQNNANRNITDGSPKEDEAPSLSSSPAEEQDISDAADSLVGDTKKPKGKAATQNTVQSGSERPKRQKVAVEIQQPRPSRKKRTIEETEESPTDSGTQNSKRAKMTEATGTQGSTASAATATPAAKRAPRRRGRPSLAEEAEKLASQSLTPPSRPPSPIELDWEDDPPKVAFSNSGLSEMANLKKFVRSKNGCIVEDLQEEPCNLLCVRKGPLKKSVKLLSCIARGIPIVTDDWLTESARKKQLLDPKDFMPKVLEQEKEMGFSLKDVWGKPQNKLLDGCTVYFTNALARTFQPFLEVDRLCRHIGARKVFSSARSAGTVGPNENVLVLGLDEKDVEAAALLRIGGSVYNRDILAASILRGGFDFDSDEFRIRSGYSPKASSQGKGTKDTRASSSQDAAPKRRGRPRKS